MRRVRPDVVVHLAGEVSGARDLELVLPMLRANLMATVNLMLACAEAGSSRVVLAGSMEEPDLGDADAVAPIPVRCREVERASPTRAICTPSTSFLSSTCASSWSTGPGSSICTSSCLT